MTKKQTEAQQNQPPQIIINSQYVRDFSFENPNAPFSILPNQKPPQINIDFNISSRDIQPPQEASNVKNKDKKDEAQKSHLTEISLIFKAEAKHEDKVAFIVELSYSGIFTTSHLSDEHKHYLINIEGPRILFPFCRSIIAQTTRDGGFPPLLLNPLDFGALYQQKMEQLQKKQAEKKKSVN